MTKNEALQILDTIPTIGEQVDALEMAIEALEQQPKTQMVDKSNFDIEQYKMDLQGAYDCGFEAGKKAEQEPCTDAVSRDFQIGDEVRIIGSDPIYDDCDVGWVIRNASEQVKTMYVMRNDGSAGEEAKVEWYKTGRHNTMLTEIIKALPSVTPQQKSGKWDRSCTCSVCKQWRILESEKNSGKYKFCPNCGSKMIEPQESEEHTE